MIPKLTLQKRNFALFLIIFTLFITTFYIYQSSDTTSYDSLTDSPIKHPSKDQSEIILEHPELGACENVDINWLASDRHYWDGRSTKAMFLQADGKFTTGNVSIVKGEAICVVILLGPSPATSVIRAEKHLGPADSIILQAKGNSTILSIELQQHRTHPNAYFASVYFSQPDVYILKGRIEYRSYFWEQPITHSYRPTSFLSVNQVTVKPVYTKPLPACNMRDPLHLDGVWMDKTVFQSQYPLDFYGMFGPIQEDHAQFGRLFVPDHCRMEYISFGQATQCLMDKVVHVWGDGNIRRNLKAFQTANRWCKGNSTAECICNDDNEDTDNSVYPWVNDPMVSLSINKTWYANTNIYYNQVGAIATKDWKKVMKTQVPQLPLKADIVILGFGNDDIPLARITPKDFAFAFENLLNDIIHHIYPHQTIIVRTPQYYCCGIFSSTSWNSGRSASFARVVRQIVRKLNDNNNNRVLLWDVYKLGIEENSCVSENSIYSRKNVVNVENILLWNLLCNSN